MNILSWNCRGAGGPRKQQFLARLLRSTRAAMAFIVETKRSRTKSKRYIEQLPLPNSVIVPACGRSGGLWLLWRDQCRVEIISANRYYIHVRIKPHDKTPWSLVCVYGDPSHILNNAIWADIKAIIKIFEEVCVVGDFNAIVKEEEKVGGVQELNKNSKDFRDFLFDAGLIDLGYKRPAFTWTNKQSTSTAIFERLDRVVVTSKWLQKYKNAYVNHLPRLHSDHAAILLRMQEGQPSAPHFKIETWWMNTEGFKEQWEQVWRETEGMQWQTRTAMVRGAMQTWARTQQTPQNHLREAQDKLYNHQLLHPKLT